MGLFVLKFFVRGVTSTFRKSSCAASVFVCLIIIVLGKFDSYMCVMCEFKILGLMMSRFWLFLNGFGVFEVDVVVIV